MIVIFAVEFGMNRFPFQTHQDLMSLVPLSIWELRQKLLVMTMVKQLHAVVELVVMQDILGYTTQIFVPSLEM